VDASITVNKGEVIVANSDEKGQEDGFFKSKAKKAWNWVTGIPRSVLGKVLGTSGAQMTPPPHWTVVAAVLLTLIL
jgi:hypothetical protein